MSTSREELKPCPFCGGEAKDNGHPLGIMGQIYCSNDDCFGPKTTAGLKEDSIKQWNTRTATPKAGVDREVLRFARPNGNTFEEMRGNVWKTDLARIGDTILVWVNEGDFWLHSPTEFKAPSVLGGVDQPVWQPIETAPKNGTRVDLLFPHPRGRTINCFWRQGNVFGEGGWYWLTPTWGDNGLEPEADWSHNCYPNMQPTHWMPSPPLPQTEAVAPDNAGLVSGGGR